MNNENYQEKVCPSCGKYIIQKTLFKRYVFSTECPMCKCTTNDYGYLYHEVAKLKKKYTEGEAE